MDCAKLDAIRYGISARSCSSCGFGPCKQPKQVEKESRVAGLESMLEAYGLRVIKVKNTVTNVGFSPEYVLLQLIDAGTYE